MHKSLTTFALMIFSLVYLPFASATDEHWVDTITIPFGTISNLRTIGDVQVTQLNKNTLTMAGALTSTLSPYPSSSTTDYDYNGSVTITVTLEDKSQCELTLVDSIEYDFPLALTVINTTCPNLPVGYLWEDSEGAAYRSEELV